MDQSKLCAALLRVVADNGDRARLRRHEALWGVRVPEGTAGQVTLRVRMYCREDFTLDDTIQSIGTTFGRWDGTCRSGLVALDSLGALADHPAVTRIELSRKLRFV